MLVANLAVPAEKAASQRENCLETMHILFFRPSKEDAKWRKKRQDMTSKHKEKYAKYVFMNILKIHRTDCGRCSSLMVSAFDSESTGPGSSLGRGHCDVFLGKTIYSRSASLHPGVNGQ